MVINFDGIGIFRYNIDMVNKKELMLLLRERLRAEMEMDAEDEARKREALYASLEAARG
jgi:hypothetical protein